MNKLVEEAPYHPGYEDAVVSPAQKYKGVDPAKMIWNNNELIRQQADKISNMEQWEKRHLDKIAELEDKLSFYEIKDLDSGLKPKPLSDEELLSMASELFHYTEYQQAIKFARMIEQRHDIK